jgi:FkbM family methyltransferase
MKRLAARLPTSWQDDLKRLHYRRQLRADRFITDEPEFALIGQLVAPGDWAIDVGANIGHYTKRMSDAVGPNGRVIAFEPVPTTFAILAANARFFGHANVTLINAAASDTAGAVLMSIPSFDSGLTNLYQAEITTEPRPGLETVGALALTIDSLDLVGNIGVVKVDAEGHELPVLRGMRDVLSRCRPNVIVEGISAEIQSELSSLGYVGEVLRGSPNTLYRVRA